MNGAILALADAVIVLHELAVRALAYDGNLGGFLALVGAIFIRRHIVQIILLVDRLNHSVRRRVHRDVGLRNGLQGLHRGRLKRRDSVTFGGPDRAQRARSTGIGAHLRQAMARLVLLQVVVSCGCGGVQT